MTPKHINIGAPAAEIIGLPDDVDRGAMFAQEHGARRCSSFSRTAKLWLRGKECAYCHAPADEAHHIFPFWLFGSLEMDDRFWLPVCRRGEDHHLRYAHLGSFGRFDILAREHAHIIKHHPEILGDKEAEAIFATCVRLSGWFTKMVRSAERSPRAAKRVEEFLREVTGT